MAGKVLVTMTMVAIMAVVATVAVVDIVMSGMAMPTWATPYLTGVATTFVSPPPFCRPGQDPSTCVPWRPTPGSDGGRGTDEGELRTVATPTTEGGRVLTLVMPVWTIVCDVRPVRVCRDRVCMVRERRCWKE